VAAGPFSRRSVQDVTIPIRSLWADTGPAATERSPLHGDATVDVAIVGAGYTGLWTAHYLRAADPTLRIAVIEAERVGFGASGRNGGWCSALAPMTATRDVQQAMFDSVREVERVTNELGIECDFARGGYLNLARTDAQLRRIRAKVVASRALGFGPDDHCELSPAEARSMAGASRVAGAAFTPHCAALHPAKLVHGLAAAVERAGVTIYEGTRVTAIEPRRVTTDCGTVRADVVVRATEAFTARLRGHRRDVLPVYSLMIATEPLSITTWNEIGLASRPTFNDARNLIIYGQRTADNRLAFGGRGAPYHFRSAIDPAFDGHDGTHNALRDVLVDLFPVLHDVTITHRWGGPLAVPRDWHASVSFDRATGMAHAGGYVGDGVSTTNLAGRTLADLITGRATDLTRLPWVNHRSRKWEPEPLRWLAVHGVAEVTGHLDRAENQGRRSPIARTVFDHFVGTD
jgi:glycine/D-amino acid oxidase-like deaminating enzyme